jgi:membrane protein
MQQEKSHPAGGALASNESEFVQRQANSASAAIGRTWGDLKADLKGTFDLRAWTRQFPWKVTSAVAAAGLVTSMAVVPRRGKPPHRSARDRRKRYPGGSTARDKLVQALVGAGRESVTTALHGALATGVAHKTAKATKTSDSTTTRADEAHRQSAPAARHQQVGDRSWWNLLKQTYNDWSEDKAPRLGAALAYYTVFSLAPLLVIALAIAGLVWGDEAAQGGLREELNTLIGEKPAGAIEGLVAQAQKPALGTIAGVLATLALLFGASGLFGQLKDALNTIWEVEPKPGRGIWATVKERFFSFTMVLGTGFMLLVSLVLTTAVSAAGNWAGNLLSISEGVLHAANAVLAFLMVTLLFALIFKLLPDVVIAWRDVWIGAVFTAVLFTVGKYLIGLYLANASMESTYGAAGSLVVLMLWVYYSSQILFLGAEFTQAYARMYGSRIRPSPIARPVTRDARAEQGMK